MESSGDWKEALELNFKKVLATIPNGVELIAVSKSKSVERIEYLYSCSKQRKFGENYIQELLEKSLDLQNKCPEIQWHLIGHIQSSKVKQVAQICNLSMIQTVDRVKIAQHLNKEFAAQNRIMDILVQVNTSKEKAKSGVEMGKPLIELVQFILNNCKNLRFCGLMTIGALVHSMESTSDSNEDFEALVRCKNVLVETLHLDVNQIKLSMGMSQDYEKAIKAGADNVRVGSAIFGERSYTITKWEQYPSASSDNG